MIKNYKLFFLYKLFFINETEKRLANYIKFNLLENAKYFKLRCLKNIIFNTKSFKSFRKYNSTSYVVNKKTIHNIVHIGHFINLFSGMLNLNPHNFNKVLIFFFKLIKMQEVFNLMESYSQNLLLKSLEIISIIKNKNCI
mmetsp:Transcript_13056/g.31987  ORF Transcript_13056/g.31987 Transcript_13056/m.31987 type:complete len:140 (+) Transcript_13056:359-778(+)